MAELVIKATDAISADPAKNQRIAKRGDWVHVEDDGFNWGRKESRAKWLSEQWEIPVADAQRAEELAGFYRAAETELEKLGVEYTVGVEGLDDAFMLVRRDRSELIIERTGNMLTITNNSAFSPPYLIVKIPGVPAAKLRPYIQPYLDPLAPADTPRALRKCLYHVRVDDVPNAIKNALRDFGEVTVTWNQVRNYIRNKQTNLDESSTPEPR